MTLYEEEQRVIYKASRTSPQSVGVIRYVKDMGGGPPTYEITDIETGKATTVDESSILGDASEI
ncbi:hypothetical protein FQN53_002311 [Emmonsiellopsis sp. PD_33]|nr:hypothetical protein FQN53_002311 [Emmonsiellopsis sp. PD_33]KAK2808390.1 hypothetical protein FQN50_004775 [Emmonsiellopsis sp. PD_5]